MDGKNSSHCVGRPHSFQRKSIETLIILRFFAGAFGSSILTNGGGVIADMIPASQRGLLRCRTVHGPHPGTYRRWISG